MKHMEHTGTRAISLTQIISFFLCVKNHQKIPDPHIVVRLQHTVLNIERNCGYSCFHMLI